MAIERVFALIAFALIGGAEISTTVSSSTKVIDCFYVDNRSVSIELVCSNGNAVKANASECWSKLFTKNNKQWRSQVNQIGTGNCLGNQLNDQFLSLFQYICVLNVSFYQMKQFHITYKASVRNLKTLNASHNNLQQIQTVDLRPLHELIEADFSFNRIQLIETIPCLKLIALNLSHNNISRVDNKIFWYLSQLKVLDMSENHIETITHVLFDRTANLEELYLQNNHLKTVDFVRNFTIIRWFNVAHNHLDGALRLLPQLGESLERLDLSWNCVGPLNSSTIFGRFKNLTHLHLSHSNVTQVSADTFDQQTHLKFLDLSNNQLSHFNFSSIRIAQSCELNLIGNQIKVAEMNEIAVNFPKIVSTANANKLLESPILNDDAQQPINSSIKLEITTFQNELNAMWPNGTVQTKIGVATISQPHPPPETTITFGRIVTWAIIAFGFIAISTIIIFAWQTHAQRQNKQKSEHYSCDISDCFEYYNTENRHDSAFD